MGEEEKSFIEVTVPMDFNYHYRIGPYITRYLEGFRERKILGSRCPACGKTAVPPRKYCGQCNMLMEEFVELPQEGTLENYTVGHVTLEKGQILPVEEPYTVGLIRLDDNASLLLARVKGLRPGEAATGMRVRAVWRDEVQGDYADLDHFEPL